MARQVQEDGHNEGGKGLNCGNRGYDGNREYYGNREYNGNRGCDGNRKYGGAESE